MTAADWREPSRRGTPEDVGRFFAGAAATVDAAGTHAGWAVGPSQLKEEGAAGWFVPLGHGMPVPEAAAIAEEWGRALCSNPLTETNVVASALAAMGTDDQKQKLLPRVVTGDLCVTWAATGLPGYWAPGSGVRARRSSEGYVLTGATTLVQAAGHADFILVAAREDDGVTQLLVPGISPGLQTERLSSLDLTRDQYEVRLDEVVVPASAVLGVAGAAARPLERQVQLALVLAVAETVGAVSALFEMALDYAGTRAAFGRPIGSFQAIKHLLVDASLELEMSRAMLTAAARAVADGQADAPEIASMAKSFVGRAAVDVAHAAWQTFGGVAYTWEHVFHLYLRRITADAARYGDGAWHNERIWDQHER